MALSGMGLFFLEAATGTALLLLFFPPRTLGKGFFTLHGAAAFLFVLLPALIHPAGLPPRGTWGAAALLLLYTAAAQAGWALAARPVLAAGGLLAARSLVLVALHAPRPEGDAWTAAGALLGGFFFGAVLLTMNLGHWYLVSRSLPFRLLARGAALFAALAASRAALLAAAVIAAPRTEGFASLFRSSGTPSFFSSACCGGSWDRSRSPTSSGRRPT